ncbi:MAG: bifunctional UDP-N-acetylmuramoyl-tripeptide:D-alanyl-D-alanine ligase/alanine racemase [Lacibacter sp.]
MISYTIEKIASLLHAVYLQKTNSSDRIEYLQTDSRRIIHPQSSLFFALKTGTRDGHTFIKECYSKGVRNFIIQTKIDVSGFANADFLLVDDTLKALQQLATFHRQQFSIPVIGITGSNGKTIVKEWLNHLLADSFSIVRSPKSYNSQIGVPLSVWHMKPDHQLGIFEAGISQPDEMDHLQKIIQPTIGLLTNIGEAHEHGFQNKQQKLDEKLKLFANAAVIICSPEKLLQPAVNSNRLFTWGMHETNNIQLIEIKKEFTVTTILYRYNDSEDSIFIPFTDDASIENALHCLATCLYLKIFNKSIKEKFSDLKPVSLRLELKSGIHNTTIINDSYSADLSSFAIALNMLQQQQQHKNKTLIVSDFPLPADQEKEVYTAAVKLIQNYSINKLITVGEKSSRYFNELMPATVHIRNFASTHELVEQFSSLNFHNETILVKGARAFELDKVAALLEQKTHQTVLEINLTAISKNIKEYRKLLNPSTKTMAMVKAFSYGSGSFEIANLLQFLKADYLAVAFTDEGVELRKAGITLPIMVMNPEPASFDALTEHNLEPELFSFSILSRFEKYLEKEALTDYPVHIKIDTGMHRLGFMQSDLQQLCNELKKKNYFTVQSVFSHLAASEDVNEDAFTLQQAKEFENACAFIQSQLSYSFIKHIDNSNGTMRHTQLQYDMVRLGIGMYGISSSAGILHLEEALSLKTTVAQIKQLKPGDTVGYNRRGVITQPSVTATVRIGYADGYPRNLSNGNGYMLVNGQQAPVIGTVCMDMTMLDITGIADVNEGDEVIVFGKDLSVNRLAQWSNTIPYEIMTGISQRVKRVYFEE